MIKDSIQINFSLINALIQETIRVYPNEACGIIYGVNNQITGFLPVTNISTEASKFIFDPDDQIKALYDLDQMGVKHLGIYHSHPLGPDHPSETDLVENSSATKTSLIISRQFDEWNLKAFKLGKSDFTEIDIEVEYSE